MLSAEEKHEIDHEIQKCPYRQGASIDALRVVQKHRGYVSDDAVKEIASYLEMSAAELDSIATFYNLIYRKPVGKNVIRICDSVSCYIMGYDKVRKRIEEDLKIGLGQTTSDNQFTLLPTQCLGTCDRAPALMINENLHRDLSENNVGEVLGSYRRAP